MTADDDGETVDDIVVECELDAAPEKVWRALTVPEFVSAWLDPKLGDAKQQSYEMIDELPCSRVCYAWRDEQDGRESTVTFEIGPRPDGNTWFRLTHSPARPARAANCNSPALARAA